MNEICIEIKSANRAKFHKTFKTGISQSVCLCVVFSLAVFSYPSLACKEQTNLKHLSVTNTLAFLQQLG
jgi:hypothetical protein